MPVRAIRAVVTALAVGSASMSMEGCSPANQLQGSLSQLTSLSFSSVDLTLQVSPPVLVVLYKDPQGAGYDVPFQLTVEVGTAPLTGSQTLAQGTVYQLGGTDANGNALAVATRSITGDSRVFPSIKMGTLTIDQAITIGRAGAGHFFLVFDYENDSSLGQGQTVEGSFQAVVNQS
jgi:hypothetical protein